MLIGIEVALLSIISEMETHGTDNDDEMWRNTAGGRRQLWGELKANVSGQDPYSNSRSD